MHKSKESLSIFTLMLSLACFFTEQSVLANNSPLFYQIPEQAVKVGQELVYEITARDLESDKVSQAILNLPEGAEFTDFGNDIAEFRWTPKNGDEGKYSLIYVADDGKSEAVSTTVDVNVFSDNGKNDPPIITIPGDQVATVGKITNFAVSAIDPDQDPIRFDVRETLPPSAQFAIYNEINFIWRPTAEDIGEHSFTFLASDGVNPESAEEVKITVQENPFPVFDLVSKRIIEVGRTLEFEVLVASPSNKALSLVANAIPKGASFQLLETNSLAQAKAKFSWTPSEADIGHYLTVFRSVDEDGLNTVGEVEIDVLPADEGNNKPEVSVKKYFVLERGRTFELDVSASDPDLDPVSLSASARSLVPTAIGSTLPEGASFEADPNSLLDLQTGETKKKLIWKSSKDNPAGPYLFSFIANDGKLSSRAHALGVFLDTENNLGYRQGNRNFEFQGIERIEGVYFHEVKSLDEAQSLRFRVRNSSARENLRLKSRLADKRFEGLVKFPKLFTVGDKPGSYPVSLASSRKFNKIKRALYGANLGKEKIPTPVCIFVEDEDNFTRFTLMIEVPI